MPFATFALMRLGDDDRLGVKDSPRFDAPGTSLVPR
jgi:hypothetical protein